MTSDEQESALLMNENLPTTSKPDKNKEPSVTPLEGNPSGGVPTLWFQQLNIFNEAVSADQLRELDEISPGFGRQFLDNILCETPHRQKMERRGQWMDFVGYLAGLFVSGCVVLGLISFAAFAAWRGMGGQAIASVITAAGMILLSLWVGKQAEPDPPPVEKPPAKKKKK